MEIYGRIDELLQAKKLSRRRLATIAKIPPTTLQSAFGRKSKGLSFEYLQRIADALDVSVDYLLGEEEYDDSEKRLADAIEILEGFDFSVEWDEDDEACGKVRLNHEEKGIATIEDRNLLTQIVEKVTADGEDEKDLYIKRRLLDIYGGRG